MNHCRSWPCCVKRWAMLLFCNITRLIIIALQVCWSTCICTAHKHIEATHCVTDCSIRVLTAVIAAVVEPTLINVSIGLEERLLDYQRGSRSARRLACVGRPWAAEWSPICGLLSNPFAAAWAGEIGWTRNGTRWCLVGLTLCAVNVATSGGDANGIVCS